MKRNIILALCAGIAVASLNNCVGFIAPVGLIGPASAMTTATANFEGVWSGSPMSVDPYEGFRTDGMVVHLRADAGGGTMLGKPEFSLKLADPYEVLKPVKGDRVSALPIKGDGGILARAALLPIKGDQYNMTPVEGVLLGPIAYPPMGKPQIGPQSVSFGMQTPWPFSPVLKGDGGTELVVAEGWNIHASPGGGTGGLKASSGAIYPDTTEGDSPVMLLLGALPEETQLIVAEGFDGKNVPAPDGTKSDRRTAGLKPGGGALAIKESGG